MKKTSNKKAKLTKVAKEVKKAPKAAANVVNKKNSKATPTKEKKVEIKDAPKSEKAKDIKLNKSVSKVIETKKEILKPSAVKKTEKPTEKKQIAPSTAKKGKKKKGGDDEDDMDIPMLEDIEALLDDDLKVVKKPTLKTRSKNELKIIDNAPNFKVSSKYKKYELEYLVHASIKLLFDFIGTPSGLADWFADDVFVKDDVYTFVWDGVQQKAKLLKLIENKLIRFQWENEPEIYFEFRIEVDELTTDVALIVCAFYEDDLSKEADIQLWNSQIEHLLKIMGSY